MKIGRQHRLSLILFVLMIGTVFALACRGDSPTATPTPTSSPEPAATATPSPAANPTPMPTPSFQPTPTPAPTLTPAPEPTQTEAPAATSTPEPAPTQAPTRLPTPGPRPQIPSDRGGLWAGKVKNPLLANILPLIAVRVIPGENPDVDTWHFRSGPVASIPDFECSPEPVMGGWKLRGCTGLRGLPRGSEITAFVPAQGESGLDVSLNIGSLTFAASLTRLPQLEEPQASPNVTLVWRQPGEGLHTDIWVEDGLVFAPRIDGRIELLDAATGQILGAASLANVAGGERDIVLDVKARGGLLYASTVSNGLVVFDVSDPASPKLIGQYRVFAFDGSPENFTNIHNIFLSPDGSLVYAINQSLVGGGLSITVPRTDLRVIDVSNPRSPKEAGRFSLETAAGVVHDVNVMERDGRLIAFLNYLRAGLLILDVTDPASIIHLGTADWDGIISHSGWPFTLGSSLCFAHTEEGYDRHLTIVDVTDPAAPKVISRFRTREGASVHNVQVVDGIAYISYYIDGLRVVDLRDPANPREIGHFDTVLPENERDILQGAFGVRVVNGLVYVSDVEGGTYAFRVDLD